MNRIKILDPAIFELDEYATRCELSRPRIRKRLMDDVWDSLMRIAEAPERWRADGDGVRKYVMRRFPITIAYSVDGEEIIILAFAHQKREPGYWLDRKDV